MTTSQVIPQRGYRVLLIEDHADLAESQARELRQQGEEVFIALTGEEGLEMARDLNPEVIVCDMNLPGINGIAVAKQLRDNGQTRKAFLVATTGAVSSHELKAYMEYAKNLGFDVVTTKPLAWDTVKQAISQRG